MALILFTRTTATTDMTASFNEFINTPEGKPLRKNKKEIIFSVLLRYGGNIRAVNFPEGTNKKITDAAKFFFKEKTFREASFRNDACQSRIFYRLK